jgi:hypothetical protein
MRGRHPRRAALIAAVRCERQPPISGDSGHGADDLGIGGEPAEGLLGAGYAVVDADLKDAPTGRLQRHLRVRPGLANELRRLTGARFIASLTAVSDLDAHRLPSVVWAAAVIPQSPAPVSPGTARSWAQDRRAGTARVTSGGISRTLSDDSNFTTASGLIAAGSLTLTRSHSVNAVFIAV